MVAPPTDETSKDEFRSMVMKLIAVTEEQARRIEELEAKLRKDSGNSSKPPSSDAPWSKKRRRRRPASGKKQGGQHGHEGTSRSLFDASDVDAIVEHRPACCSSCGGSDLETIERAPNAAERAVRKPVLWRKGSFGSQSEHGCRFVERILAVAATLRQQQRNVFDYLVEVASAPLSGRPPPALLPATALPG